VHVLCSYGYQILALSLINHDYCIRIPYQVYRLTTVDRVPNAAVALWQLHGRSFLVLPQIAAGSSLDLIVFHPQILYEYQFCSIFV
jgi:hypothetical protein